MEIQWEHTLSRPGVWDVALINAEGGYELTGPFPVQGVGVVQGIDIYFGAAYDAWSFETHDEKGWLFPSEDRRFFQRGGAHQGAGSMPHEVAAKIIAQCVGELMEQLRSEC